MFFQNLPPVIRGILVAFVVTFVLSIIVPSLTLSILPLFSQLVVPGLQIWRVITYPFYWLTPGGDLIGNLFRLLWIGMVIVFFGGELETIIHSKRFAVALGLTIFLGGVLFSFLSPEGTLMGPHVITMFILAGFAYLWPSREISVMGLFNVKAWIVALVIFIVTVIPLHGYNMDTSASNLFAPFFGALSALVYFHFTFRQYDLGATVLNRFAAKKPAKPTVDLSDPRSIQHHIDSILDKISKKGMDSLSREEKDFLLKHSS